MKMQRCRICGNYTEIASDHDEVIHNAYNLGWDDALNEVQKGLRDIFDNS